MLGLGKRLKAKILQASTSGVYGDPNVHPPTEDYGGMSIRLDHDPVTMRQNVARRPCFSTIGASTGCANFIVQALLGHDITVYGEGSQTRSFCYVDDLIDGLMRLMATDDAVTRPINIGNPTEFSILELASLVVDLTGSRSSVAHRPLPENDPRQRRPDISRARELNPTTTLKEGLIQTIAYFEQLLTQDGVKASLVERVG